MSAKDAIGPYTNSVCPRHLVTRSLKKTSAMPHLTLAHVDTGRNTAQ